jgi:hypothetical protein
VSVPPPVQDTQVVVPGSREAGTRREERGQGRFSQKKKNEE